MCFCLGQNKHDQMFSIEFQQENNDLVHYICIMVSGNNTFWSKGLLRNHYWGWGSG